MAVAQVAGMRPAAVALMVVLSAADIVGRPHGASYLGVGEIGDQKKSSGHSIVSRRHF